MYQTHYDEQTKIWSGNYEKSVLNPKVSAGEVLLKRMLKFSTRIAQISDNNDIEVTFKEMYLKSVRIAENLRKMGYRQGDVIGFVTANHHDLTPFIVGALTLGLPVSILDSMLGEGEIQQLFNISKPKLIICENHKIITVHKAIKNFEGSIKLYSFDSRSLANDFLCNTGTEDSFVPPNIGNSAEIPAAYICTSGTSGLPKCYAYTHASLLHNLGNVIQPLQCDDVITTLGSLYWVTGWAFMLSNILNGCKRIITTEPFSAKILLKIIQKYKVTFTFTPPSGIAELLNCDEIECADCSSLKYYLTGGSPVATTLIEKLQKILPHAYIQRGYGTTEGLGLISRTETSNNLETVGLLDTNTKAKILDGQGNMVGINEIGEICTWKKYNSLGYVNNVKATKEIRETDGWIHTGDYGYFDKNGYLYIVDRKKDILKYHSYQISPSEIENVIQSNVNVNNVSVVGIPDTDYSDLPTAFVIRSKSNPTVTEQDIQQIVTKNLSSPKQLRGGVYFLDKFPLNISGKVLRRELKELAIKFHAMKQK